MSGKLFSKRNVQKNSATVSNSDVSNVEPLRRHFCGTDLVILIILLAVILALGYLVIQYNIVSQDDYLVAQQKYNVSTPMPSTPVGGTTTTSGVLVSHRVVVQKSELLLARQLDFSHEFSYDSNCNLAF